MRLEIREIIEITENAENAENAEFIEMTKRPPEPLDERAGGYFFAGWGRSTSTFDIIVVRFATLDQEYWGIWADCCMKYRIYFAK